MATTTETASNTTSIPIKPTPVWVPLKVEGEVPEPYRTPKCGFKVIPKAPTFVCELKGVDFSRPVSSEEAAEIREVVDKYGVVVCRRTGLTDEAHIEFSRHFGDLDDIRPYVKAGRINRLSAPELFDAGNIDVHTGKVAPLSAAQVIGNKANEQFHVDSSFNGRRAGHSLLLSWVLPPAGMGGSTEFADTRAAYEDLSPDMKQKLEGLVANHSLFHSRKKAVPDYFKDLDPKDHPLSKHQVVQQHEWSKRMNLYVASYCYSIEGMSDEEGTALIEELLAHTGKPKYRCTVEWEQPGDMIIWDNTSVQHRATGGSFEGIHPRDMRRTTVKDMSSTKFGLNGEGADWRVGMP